MHILVDFQNKIFKGTEKVDFLRGQMNWDQQALEAWLEESAKRDEDALILEKYAKVDEGKIKVRPPLSRKIILNFESHHIAFLSEVILVNLGVFLEYHGKSMKN